MRASSASDLQERAVGVVEAEHPAAEGPSQGGEPAEGNGIPAFYRIFCEIVAVDRQHLHSLSMRIGVPREVKNHEYRVALTPAGAQELTRERAPRARRARRRASAARSATPTSRPRARASSAPPTRSGPPPTCCSRSRSRSSRSTTGCAATRCCSPTCTSPRPRPCTQALLDAGTTAIAYETVRLPDGSLPLLAPMSEVAGRLAPQAGADALMRAAGGRGVLLGGVPGVRPGERRGDRRRGVRRRTRWPWPSGSAPTSRSSTSTSPSCAASTSATRAASAPSRPTPTSWRRRAWRPTW